MKIIVVHGTDIEKSYQRLTRFIDEAKKRNWDVIYDKIEVTPSLFGKERLFLIKDYKLLPKKLDKELNGTVVVYHEGQLAVTILKSLNPEKVEKYDLAPLIWQFINRPSTRLLEEVLKSEAVEFVFIMLARKLIKNYLASPIEVNKKLVEEMAEIDLKAKTGQGELSLLLDLFISKHLE